MDLLTDKKLIIGGMASVAFVFVVILVAGYTNLPDDLQQVEVETGGPGSCLMLEERYCNNVRFFEIDTSGAIGAAFNVPEGTLLFMPFDGIYFDDSSEATALSGMQLLSSDEASSITVLGGYIPTFSDSSSVSGGAVVATVGHTEGSGQDADFNLVIYGDNYDLESLFR